MPNKMNNQQYKEIFKFKKCKKTYYLQFTSSQKFTLVIKSNF